MTATVIDFQKFRNARLATASAATVAPTATHVAAAETAPALEPEAPRYVPAYCDPNNLRVGDKFVQSRDVVEIAKLIRADIAAAIKSGALPKIKTSVKIDRSSMSSSISIRVTQVPAGFVRWEDAYIRAHVLNTRDHDRVITHRAEALLNELERIAKDYRRDNSSIADDYFDVNFYLSVEFDHDIGRDQWKAVEAQVRAERGY